MEEDLDVTLDDSTVHSANKPRVDDWMQMYNLLKE